MQITNHFITKTGQINSNQLVANVVQRISAVQGDFRQKASSADWQKIPAGTFRTVLQPLIVQAVLMSAQSFMKSDNVFPAQRLPFLSNEQALAPGLKMMSTANSFLPADTVR